MYLEGYINRTQAIKAIKSKKPTLIDVPMINNPTPTTGHWNILDIYSPNKKISHVST